MTRRRWARVGGIAVVVALWLLEAVIYSSSGAADPGALRWGGHVPPPAVLAVSAVVTAVTLVRSRRPLLAYGIAWTFGVVAALALVSYQPFAALLLAVHGVARYSSGRVASAALIGVAVPFGVSAYNSMLLVGGPSGFLLPFLLWMTISAVAWNFGRIGRLSAERAAQREQILAAEAEAALQAQRLQLARELHDIVAHSLSAMVLQAAGGRALAELPGTADHDDPRVRESLRTIEDTGVQAMREMHRLLGLLRAADEPGAEALLEGLADLEQLLAGARAGGLRVELVATGSPGPLDRSVEHAAYRVVQEALTNVAKHAGPGAEATVTLRWRSDALDVAVTSRGGAPTGLRELLSSGHGLLGLEERVGLLEGEFEAGFAGDGFRVHAHLPTRTVRPRPAAEQTERAE